jgi:hypothetical protein
VNDAVIAYGTPLVEDHDRIGAVSALGLDETLFCRRGRWRTQQWCTSIVDVSPGHTQLLDVVAGRSATGPSRWLEGRPKAWCEAIRFGVLDLSGPYRKTFDDTLPDVTQVADPFHLIRLANTKLDECRRRVQNETVGHRGRKDDALYRARRLLTKAHERLDERGEQKLVGLLEAGDPRGEVRTAWHANYPALGGRCQRLAGEGVRSSRWRWRWRLSMTRLWRAVSEVQPRWAASSRRALMSWSCAVRAGMNSGVVTKLGQVSQMLA